ncbi:MAG: carboxylesterase/lipase family protein [Steroidobacteraceae bacterium]
MRSLLRLSLCSALCLLAACGPTPESPTPVAAEITRRALPGLGEIVGFENPAGGHSWLGLPYATPPLKSLRWRAPQAPQPWTTRREALRAGSPCIQFGSPLGGVGEAGSRQGSEDCLYLNVYAPALRAEELSTARLPVMVWIHGGGNTVGHAAFYEGATLAARGRVLVVMLNYRLGPFGWFRPPEGVTDDPLDASGNYGNLDVLEALRWVQRHAAQFGGDIGNVTVFGESAGGTNALALLVTPAADGLFHRLIVQSLGFGFSSIPTPGSSFHASAVLERALRLSQRASDATQASRLAAEMSPAEQLAFLRSLDPWTFYAAYGSGRDEFDRLPSVFQDGVVHRVGELRQLLADPATHIDVPVILGTNRDETKIFMAFDPQHVRRVAGLPFALRDAQRYDLEARYRAMLWTADGVDSVAEPLSRHGAPAYAYRWDWDEQGKAYGLIDLSRIVGAAHGLEIPFVLGYFDLGPQSELLFHEGNAAARLALSDRMMGYWVQFARSGTPGRGTEARDVEWLAWRSDSPRRLVFDTPAGGDVRMLPGLISRDAVLAGLEAEALTPPQRCALFRATFRNRDDAWADAAWPRIANGACAGARLTRSETASE